MKRKLLLVFTVLFFTAITALTFTARGIHNAGLPHVTAKRLTREVFDGYARKLAVPKSLLESGDLYVITVRYVNGEKRDYAQKAQLTLGVDNEAFVEVTGGMMGNELVIFESDREVRSGDEVFVVK